MIYLTILQLLRSDNQVCLNCIFYRVTYSHFLFHAINFCPFYCISALLIVGSCLALALLSPFKCLHLKRLVADLCLSAAFSINFALLLVTYKNRLYIFLVL